MDRAESRKRNRPKNQHWVPKFYLRYFATSSTRDTDAPQVWIFSKQPDDGDEQLTSVRNVCGKRFLYSPTDLDGTRNWDVEEELGEIEALLGEIWPVLATDFVDLGDETVRKALSLFIASTHLRHPEVRAEIENLHGRLVAFYENIPKGPDGIPMVESVIVKGKEHAFDASGWNGYKNQGKDGHDRFFVDAIRPEAARMARHLLKKRWSMLVSEKESFVTSDKPVVLRHHEKEAFGYGTDGATVMFPISPTRVLVLDDANEPANQYYAVLENNIGAINFCTWSGAHRFLISGRPVSEVLEEFEGLSAELSS